MKVFAAIFVVLILAFAGFKMTQTPSAVSVKAVQHENMTQFGNDLAQFMKADVVKESGMSADLFHISAKCKPNQGVDHTRCWVTIRTPLSKKPEKATAENVRRVGDKFVWDRES